MSKGLRLSGLFGLLVILSCSSGCVVQEAIQKGLTDGISAALSYLIKTPVTVAVDQAVKPPQ